MVSEGIKFRPTSVEAEMNGSKDTKVNDPYKQDMDKDFEKSGAGGGHLKPTQES